MARRHDVVSDFLELILSSPVLRKVVLFFFTLSVVLVLRLQPVRCTG